MKRAIEKGIILGVTGIPGVQKILILFFVSLFHSVNDLGSYVNDVFIVMMLTYFTAINWSSILISDVNKYPHSLRPKFYGQIISNVSVYCLFFLIIVFALYKGGWLQDPTGSAVYFFCYTYYQLWRHYLLSRHSYNSIFVLDVILLVLFFTMIYIASIYNLNLLIAIGVIFLLPFIYTNIVERVPFVLSPKFRNKLALKFHSRAFYSGISGFATASPSLFIAPFSYRMLTPEYTSVIGFFTNIVNVIYLLPRAYSLYSVPLLSKAYSEKNHLKEKYAVYLKSMNKMLFLLLFALLVFFAVYMYVASHMQVLNLDKLPHVNTICLLMLLSGMLAQFMLPVSNLSVILRQEALVTKINVIVLIVFGASFYLVYLLLDKGIELIILYQLMLLLTVGARFWMMKKAIVIE